MITLKENDLNNNPRVCKDCGLTKPIEESRVNNNTTGGYRWRIICKQCKYKKEAIWRKKNLEHVRSKGNNWMRMYRNSLEGKSKEEYLLRNARNKKKRNKKLKEDVFNAYGGNVCACCGETEFGFLSIDHVNNDGYIMRKEIGEGGYRFYNWLRKNKFPDSFQVLCTNCQHGKARNNGICPHLTNK